jgi:hypothetical protein
MLLQFVVTQTPPSSSFPSPVDNHIINEVFQSCEPVSYFNLILFLTEELDNRVVIEKDYGLEGKV